MSSPYKAKGINVHIISNDKLIKLNNSQKKNQLSQTKYQNLTNSINSVQNDQSELLNMNNNNEYMNRKIDLGRRQSKNSGNNMNETNTEHSFVKTSSFSSFSQSNNHDHNVNNNSPNSSIFSTDYITSLTNQISVRESQRFRLSRQIEQLKQYNLGLMDTIRIQRQNSIKLYEEKDKLIREYYNGNIKLTEEIKRLGQEMMRCKQLHQKSENGVRNQNQGLRRQIGELSYHLDNCQKMMMEKERTISNVFNTLAMKEKQLKQFVIKIQTLQVQRLKDDKMKILLRQEINRLNEEIGGLRSEVARKSSKINKSEEMMKLLEEERGKNSKVISEYESKVGFITFQYQQIEQEMRKREKQIVEFQQEVLRKNQLKVKSDKKVQQLQCLLSQKQKHITALQNTNSMLRKQIISSINQQENLKQELKSNRSNSKGKYKNSFGLMNYKGNLREHSASSSKVLADTPKNYLRRNEALQTERFSSKNLQQANSSTTKNYVFGEEKSYHQRAGSQIQSLGRYYDKNYLNQDVSEDYTQKLIRQQTEHQQQEIGRVKKAPEELFLTRNTLDLKRIKGRFVDRQQYQNVQGYQQ